MTEEKRSPSPNERKKAFWAGMALSVRNALLMHQVSSQMTKDPQTRERPWGNVTEHCLVEISRAEVLGRWIVLPEDLILDMKRGAVLHDFSKRQEITAIREANQNGTSPFTAVKKVQSESEQILIDAGFDERVRRLAGATGGYAPQLLECQRILDQSIPLSDDDWAYLIVHYVDGYTINAEWVKPSQVNGNGNRVNAVDYHTEVNKAKTDYSRIAGEIRAELAHHPLLSGLEDHHYSMSIVSHQIERRLGQRIVERTGESVDPLQIPELVDQKIKMAIEGNK